MSVDVSSPIALRHSDRAILIGTSGTGKSTLAAYLLDQFKRDYPDSRRLILDTKPRWRAEYLPTGQSTRRYYRRFVKGDLIPRSMTIADPRDWGLVWSKDTNPSQTVVVQRLHGSERANLQFQLWCAQKFFASQDARRKSLIYFDEGMDFFNTSAGARGGSDIVQRCFRAGREMGLTSMIGVQRPKGINLQTLTEASYCALFRIQFAEDVKRLWEMGWPRDVTAPSYDQDHVFRVWRVENGPVAPAFKLEPKGRR